MRTTIVLFLALMLALPALVSAQTPENRLYGTLTTQDGDVYEGLIRWDKNEASWVDILDGSKRIEHRPRRARRRTFRIFGIRFSDDDGGASSRSSGIRFGHLASLENMDNRYALLTLRSGQEMVMHNQSTDIGSSVRGIIVETKREGTVELRWRDLDRIDFAPVPKGYRASRSGEHLWGTLTTRRGQSFSGYVCWDIDEVLGEDILDGEDERGRDREIRFDQIAALARNSSRSTLVTLKTGEELVLRGTNDVNSGNRGILVMDPNLGQIRVSWDEFDEVTFGEPTQPFGYDDFYASRPLTGTVETADGDKYTGQILWDDDEAHTWELLDGEMDDVDFEIEFGLISKIERLSRRAALVTLIDGREFELHGSNDVNDDNDGIYILSDNGDEIRLDWDDFESVIFEKP